mgnify:FL=1
MSTEEMGAASIPAHFSQAYGPRVAKRQRTLTEIHMNDHDYPTNNTSNHVEENSSTATDETKMLLPTPVGSGSGVSSRWTAQPVFQWVELIAAESADLRGPLDFVLPKSPIQRLPPSSRSTNPL